MHELHYYIGNKMERSFSDIIRHYKILIEIWRICIFKLKLKLNQDTKINSQRGELNG